MVMNPRTHPRGAKPDFTLPRVNPNPSRMTNALWWLVCMRELLEPEDTENGGTFANKPGSHNAGENLRDYGQGNTKTDHSIRDSFNRTGPWWKQFCAAHDWTFRSAQRGNFTNISKYTSRLIKAMKDPNDPRPDDVYFYTIGQADSDRVVEGYNERDDDAETGDESHLWHRHDSFRRNIIGDFWAMWKALTIDMGWTVAEWRQSIQATPEVRKMIKLGDVTVPEIRKGDKDQEGKTQRIKRIQAILNWYLPGLNPLTIDGDYGNATTAGVKEVMKDDPKRSSKDGSIFGEAEYRRFFGL